MKYNLLNQVGQWELIDDNPCCQSFCQLLNSHWRWKWSGKGGSDSEWSGSMINQIASEVWCQLNGASIPSERQGRLFSLSQQMSMIFRLWCNRWPWHSSRWWVSIYATVQPTMQRTQEQCDFRKERSQLHQLSQNWVSVQIFIAGLQAAAITTAGLMRRWPKTPQICGLSIVCPDLYRYHIWQWIIGLKLSIICCLSIIFLIIIILTYDRYMNHGYHWLHCNLSIIGRILVIGLFFGHFVQ